MTRDDAYRDWRDRANSVPLLVAAKKYRAVLKKAGREWVGPCPNCGGNDRLALNEAKSKWNCRGAVGGNTVISFVMHVANLSMAEACEGLTGVPPPNGPAKPLSAEEKQARAKRQADNEASQRQLKAREELYREDTKETATAIWNASIPVRETLAEKYLNSRGIPTADIFRGIGGLRFNPSLPYPNKRNYPALVCRVDDMSGALCAIWRIFLREDGRKADVPDAKLGLGPAGGGAVRIGGNGPKIGLAEGVESALGAWNLIGRKYPIWAGLSTSGLIGIELPLGVGEVICFPDGDASMRRKDGEYIPAVPAGRKAALALKERLISEGLRCTIASEPSAGKDYCDLWNEHARETA